MKIKSAWGIGTHAGKIVSVANGERGFIHLRSTLEIPLWTILQPVPAKGRCLLS